MSATQERTLEQLLNGCPSWNAPTFVVPVGGFVSINGRPGRVVEHSRTRDDAATIVTFRYAAAGFSSYIVEDVR